MFCFDLKINIVDIIRFGIVDFLVNIFGIQNIHNINHNIMKYFGTIKPETDFIVQPEISF